MEREVKSGWGVIEMTCRDEAVAVRSEFIGRFGWLGS